MPQDSKKQWQARNGVPEEAVSAQQTQPRGEEDGVTGRSRYLGQQGAACPPSSQAPGFGACTLRKAGQLAHFQQGHWA